MTAKLSTVERTRNALTRATTHRRMVESATHKFDPARTTACVMELDAYLANFDARHAVTADNCPGGGNHTPGQSGEWAGRCTKCGAHC